MRSMSPSPRSSTARFRWRRLVAACGAITSLVALVSLVPGNGEQPDLLSLWLLVSGLALAVLSLHAARGGTATLRLPDERRAERARAASARRAAEERAIELAETSPDLLTLHKADGTLSYVAPACRELLGFEPEELVGRAPEELVHPEDAPVLLAVRNRAREADDVTATLRLRRRDERYVWVEAKLRIVRDADTREVVETHAIVRDVHERVEAQRALAEAEERFRTAFEEGAIGMAITGVDGRLLRVNRALCAVTGHREGELDGRTML